MYIDTHLDTMYQSLNIRDPTKSRVFEERSGEGHVDLFRAREGGLFIGFFTGFPTDSSYTTELMVRNWIEYYLYNHDHVTQVTNLRELEAHQQHFQTTTQDKRKIGALLHFEGAAGIDTELNRLYMYHKIGLRSMGLTWNEQNQFATGVGYGDPNRGITQEGKDLLDVMENMGIMIDVSHLNDKSFWEVVNHTNKPLFASHSNVRSICSHKRNLTEEMVTAIVDSGGTIGINLCQSFLTDEAGTATMNSAVDMFVKVIELSSPDHVHVGSDMDGCQIPEDMKDITSIPTLLNAVQQRLDLSLEDMEKIENGNMIRMMRSYWS